MWHGNSQRRTRAKEAFMGLRDSAGNLVHEECDTIIGLVGKIGTSINLQRAEIVILMEPTYKDNLFKQLPKRAHRQGTKHPVYFYTIYTDTEIEKTVENRRLARQTFTENAFVYKGLAKSAGATVDNPVVLLDDEEIGDDDNAVDGLAI